MTKKMIGIISVAIVIFAVASYEIAVGSRPNPTKNNTAQGSKAVRTTTEACSFSFRDGWNDIEKQDPKNWLRWSKGNGSLLVKVAKPTVAVLTGEINSIQKPNKVDIILNGQKVHTLNVNWTEWEFRSVGKVSLKLKAGENIVEFVSQNPPIKQPTDPRPMTYALRNISLTFNGGSNECQLAN